MNISLCLGGIRIIYSSLLYYRFCISKRQAVDNVVSLLIIRNVFAYPAYIYRDQQTVS